MFGILGLCKCVPSTRLSKYDHCMMLFFLPLSCSWGGGAGGSWMKMMVFSSDKTGWVGHFLPRTSCQVSHREIQARYANVWWTLKTNHMRFFYTPPPFSLCFVVVPIFRHLENNRLERIEAADFPIVMNDLEELWVWLLLLCRESGCGIHPTHIQNLNFST